MDDLDLRAGARFDLVQHLFTLTPGLAPPAHTLLVGELGLELANPPKIWAGVPTDIDPSGRKLLYNSEWVFFPEAPTDGVVYGRQGSSTSWKGVLPLTAGITNKLTNALYIDSTTTGLAAAIHLTTPGWPAVVWNTTSADTAAGYFESRRYGLSRWSVEFGGSEPETGYNDGTNFLINRFDDTGAALYPSPLQIIRADGSINIGTPLTVYANTNISGDLDVIGTPGADGSGGAWLAVHGSEILGRGGDAELSAGASIEPGSGGNLQLAAGEGFGAGQRGGFLLLSAGFGADGAVSGPIVLDTNNTSSGIGSLSPGAYVYGPLNVNGNLTIAPTGNAILNLVKTGGSTNVNVIAGLTDGVLRWQMQLGNGNPESGSSAGSDFALYNYNDAGAYIGNPLFINRATGIVTLPNGLIVNSNITAGLPTGGKVKLNPGDAGHTGYIAFHNASDVRQAYFGYASGATLFLQLEDATTNFQISAYTVRLAQGRLISQGNAINPSLAVYETSSGFCGGIWQEAGGNFVFGDCDSNGVPTVWRMYLDRSSNLWVVGTVTTSYLHSTGSIAADGTVSANVDLAAAGRVYSNDSMNYSGTFYVANNYNYYLARSPGDYAWRFVEGGTTNLTIDSAGNAIARTSLLANNGIVQASAGIYALNGQAGIYAGGNGVVMQFAANWYLDWNVSNGTLIWMQWGGNAQWVMHADTSCYNNRNWTGGRGPYQDLSDERSKTDITSAVEGLDAVLAINPIRFKRIGEQFKREEIGFSAQQLREALPEAVTETSFELPEDAGDEPALAVATTPIIAALVNSVKELAARVATLEATAH
jgi:hypothetical protein